ncbi:hypothetical protein FHX46_004711 [Amycolatopsis viridis]|uniref:Uncharacterized protein n=1 Tax=Amycolatopsis viridis TaxID=185678 RepID=A0ABX0SYZ5_9PSEU|nr:hypothetical protein [Amycolatopsis viridis]
MSTTVPVSGVLRVESEVPMRHLRYRPGPGPRAVRAPAAGRDLRPEDMPAVDQAGVMLIELTREFTVVDRPQTARS